MRSSLAHLRAGGFKLRDRAVHVYNEAKRVPDFKAICDGDLAAAQKVQELAHIMNDSQASCRWEFSF